MKIRICRWDDFQHYDRTRRTAPPWIRLYRRLLDDLEYRRLSGDAKAFLVDLWLLAGESKDGTVTGDPADLAWRLRLSTEDTTLAIQEIAAVRDTDGNPKWIELSECASLGKSTAPLARREQAASLGSTDQSRAEQSRAEAEDAAPPRVMDSLQKRRDQARSRLTPEGQEAYDGFMRAAGNPDALALEINMLCDGGHNRLYTPEHVSQALHDLRVSGVNRPTARQLRRWTEAAATPDAPIKGAESLKTITDRVIAKQGGNGASAA